ncbi:hypothetical protein PoB_006995400 [Plakobranchus ocellatus]|uniref:Uncharacterized protein n=1 Tax=Plakobranchus ocellatus TaxID=259542 RepID=A0AAV4DH08_9GAST|nr:hypothetical protein PoB_006995400 [Plakobranchus ocellatus]
MGGHTHVLEALERLLFASFLQNTSSGGILKELLSSAKEPQISPGQSLAQSIISSQVSTQFFAQYEVFKKQTGDDGLALKTNKETLIHKLENTFNCFESQDFSRQPNTAYIIDGNALPLCLSSGPDTFGGLAKQAFRSLPQTASVNFVTDTYKPDSIKSCERLGKGASTAKSYVLQGLATKVPKISNNFCLMMETRKL